MTIAKKDYVCDLCGYTIKKGTDYYRDDVKPWDYWNESWKYYTFTTHAECNKLAEDLGFYDEEGLDNKEFKKCLLRFFEYDKENVHEIVHEIEGIISLPVKDGINPWKRTMIMEWIDFIKSQTKPEVQEASA